ncbi:MAG: DNA replication and repair protein RecF [Erysipelotrichaceae bacterium]|nr:DNA replication and repair protein RecF [Erysipelotrichaceae bacterium]
MLVKSLKLNNYRNYTSRVVNFDSGLNLIIGKNGIGKTNILESLVVVSNTKSFRTLDDTNLIKIGEEYAGIECQSDTSKYKVVISKNGKRLYINDVPVKKTSEFIGSLNCVLFKPSDLDIFNHSPKERRRLLDVEIGKVSKKYLNSILEYNLLLKDKNRLLKEEKIDHTYLSLIEEKMIPDIKEIISQREEFLELINTYISDIYQNISNEKSKISIIYKKCSDKDKVKEMIEKSHDKDLYYHYATYGPHHDDYEIMMNDHLLEEIASQGQTRMVLISFKLALIKYIESKTGNTPVLLLDDILSELDTANKERLLKLIPQSIQIIITGTDLNGMNLKTKYKLIELKEGENV